MARRKVEEVDVGRVELDIEAILDSLEDRSLVDVVVASVDDADSSGPAFLGRTDSCPKDPFASSTSVAEPQLAMYFLTGSTVSTRRGGRSPQCLPTACPALWLHCRL